MANILTFFGSLMFFGAWAHAGQLVCTGLGDVSFLDSRSGQILEIGNTHLEISDSAYDFSRSLIITQGFGSFMAPDCLEEVDPRTGSSVCVGPGLGRGVAFSPQGDMIILDYPIEYFPIMDCYITIDNATSSIMCSNTSQSMWQISTYPTGFTSYWNSVAWDDDLRLVWLFTLVGTEYRAVALEPTNLTPVAWFGMENGGTCWSATTGPDNVPNQTPELFISGACPGDLTVTIADGTPGGDIRIATGTRSGRRQIPSGACAGTPTDLANPRERLVLQADSFGIATTTFPATPGMCGQWMVQALDEGSCQTTTVKPIPAAAPVP